MVWAHVYGALLASMAKKKKKSRPGFLFERVSGYVTRLITIYNSSRTFGSHVTWATVCCRCNRSGYCRGCETKKTCVNCLPGKLLHCANRSTTNSTQPALNRYHATHHVTQALQSTLQMCMWTLAIHKLSLTTNHQFFNRQTYKSCFIKSPTPRSPP